jgi:hypothetical protein
VPRKLALLIAALVIPGGFVALLCVLAMRFLQHSERGRKVIALARRGVPTFTGFALGPQRVAA